MFQLNNTFVGYFSQQFAVFLLTTINKHCIVAKNAIIYKDTLKYLIVSMIFLGRFEIVNFAY
jgi:hypothetical protein